MKRGLIAVFVLAMIAISFSYIASALTPKEAGQILKSDTSSLTDEQVSCLANCQFGGNCDYCGVETPSSTTGDMGSLNPSGTNTNTNIVDLTKPEDQQTCPNPTDSNPTCGGSNCRQCDEGQLCKHPTDCISNLCPSGKCVKAAELPGKSAIDNFWAWIAWFEEKIKSLFHS